MAFVKMDENDTRDALLAFGQAAIAIALDCEPGGDDDHAKDFGLAIEQYVEEDEDDKGAHAILVRLADMRVYRIYLGIVPAEWPQTRSERDREKAADRAEVIQGDVPDPRQD